jgi:hypothetical protein
MNVSEDKLAVIVAALRRGSEHTLLQRRVTFVLDEIEEVLMTGWSLPELAAHLAAAGVTQRDGRSLSGGHFAVLVTRARAKSRAAARLMPVVARLPPRTTRPVSPHVPVNHSVPAATDVAVNLAKVAEQAERRAEHRERQAATEHTIDATLDAMFGRTQSESRRPRAAKASSSSTLKRRRQAP